MFNVEPLSCSHSFLHTVQVSILMTKVDFETMSSLLFFFFEFIPLRGCDFILETMFTLDLGKRFDNRNRLNHSFLFYATFRVLFFSTYHMISISWVIYTSRLKTATVEEVGATVVVVGATVNMSSGPLDAIKNHQTAVNLNNQMQKQLLCSRRRSYCCSRQSWL